MKDKKCNCKSYNAQVSADEPENVIIETKEYFKWDKQVCVDPCIEHVIIHLWKNGIWTLGSCCGHNGLFDTSVIVEQGLSIKEAIKIKKLIKEVDDREFTVYSWILTAF